MAGLEQPAKPLMHQTVGYSSRGVSWGLGFDIPHPQDQVCPAPHRPWRRHCCVGVPGHTDIRHGRGSGIR